MCNLKKQNNPFLPCEVKLITGPVARIIKGRKGIYEVREFRMMAASYECQ